MLIIIYCYHLSRENMDYQKQATDFLKKTKTTFSAKKSENQSSPLWAKPEDKHGYKYDIVLERNGQVYKFNFWGSIADREKEEQTLSDYKKPLTWRNHVYFHYDMGYFNAQAGLKKELKENPSPTAYDILACLNKHEVGSLSDFCGDFGYDEDSKKATEIYLAVMEEGTNINRLFSDVLEELQEIN